jgi:isoquinoline 1-oxidoreductase subunit beta
MGKWTRRAVIASGGLLGGGLVLGVAGFTFAPNRLSVGRRDPELEGSPQLNTWIRIAPDGTATALVPHCEMGQGAHTALAMMLADELDADWSLVRVEEAPAEGAFANGYLARAFVPALASVPGFLERGIDYGTFKLTELIGLQVTGGSSSVRGTGHYGMRVAGAAARAMLIDAAAQRWAVDPAQCKASASRVVHEASGRSAGYGELAADAARLDPPAHPRLKTRDEWSIAGRPIPRLDIPSKVDGSASFGIDVQLPDMLYATIAAAPVFGARLASVDASVAAGLPGVKKVVQLEDAVAVVADGYWRALKALRALQPAFGDAGHSSVTSDAIFDGIRTSLETEPGEKVFASGDAAAALEGATPLLDVEYQVPFLAHATMEPMNATARVEGGRCELWTGVQDPLSARRVAAQAAGLDAEQVVVHNQQLGGGFGRRLPGALDFVEQAVRIAVEMTPAPVKLVWSREEDLQHDYYRPAVIGRYRAAVNADGAPRAWIAKFSGEAGEGAARIPYAVANQDIRSVSDATHIRRGAWRSVAHSQHGFFTESFIDELAHAAGVDPFEYRRKLLAASPRHRAVLEKAAELAGWGGALASGTGRGIALVESFGSIVAEVAEVEVSGERIRVRRVWAVVDCGDVINPDTAAAQIEGGIVFGMSAALWSEITIREGRVAQTNFTDYPLPNLADTPEIAVEFIRSGAALGGLGEPGVPPIAPAIGNAVFAATGKRLRTLPLRI